MWDVVQAQGPLGHYELEVPKGPNRTARTALMQVRATPVVLPLKHGWTKKLLPVELFAVQALEISPVPAGRAAH